MKCQAEVVFQAEPGIAALPGRTKMHPEPCCSDDTLTECLDREILENPQDRILNAFCEEGLLSLDFANSLSQEERERLKEARQKSLKKLYCTWSNICEKYCKEPEEKADPCLPCLIPESLSSDVPIVKVTRGPGRPKKNALPPGTYKVSEEGLTLIPEQTVKRKPGRPRKYFDEQSNFRPSDTQPDPNTCNPSCHPSGSQADTILKRGPGRPRKYFENISKRPPGRPRKYFEKISKRGPGRPRKCFRAPSPRENFDSEEEIISLYLNECEDEDAFENIVS